MHCSTNLQISPILPRLPRAFAWPLILSLLVRTSHPIATAQRLWLPVIPMPCGRWCWRKVRHDRVPALRWAPLLARLLARWALLAVLLYASRWGRRTPLSWCVLLLPVAQILALKVTPHVSEPKRMRRWDNGLHRLYQLLVLALLIRTLDPLLSPPYARATGMSCSLLVGTWRCQPDEETEVAV